MKIVRERVKPERDRLAIQRDASARNSARFWWQFRRKGQALYSTIADMKRVLVKAQVSKTWGWTFVPNDWVYDQKLVVFAFDSNAEFALLQSSLHWNWAIQYGATLRLDMSYTPTTSFETFPFPNDPQNLESIGECYYLHRQSIMLSRQEGLTKAYNRFHDPNEKAANIVKLRELHREMDEAVARAYGWDDVRLEHGFHETKQGMRYTISEAARREVLDRLLLLNHQRHEEEVQAGLFGQSERKGGKGRSNGKKHSREDERKDDLQRVLFSE